MTLGAESSVDMTVNTSHYKELTEMNTIAKAKGGRK